MIPRLLWITQPERSLDAMEGILDQVDEDLSRLAILYRRPSEDIRQRLEGARLLRRWTKDAGALLLTQDLELALCVGADGVHLPEASAPISAIRPHVSLLGASRHSQKGLKEAFASGADYCTLSPLFDSPGKGEALGVEGFAQSVQGMGPVLALGGVVDGDAASRAIAHGAAGVATIRGVHSAQSLRALLDAFASSS